MTASFPSLIGIPNLMRIAFGGDSLKPVASQLLGRLENNDEDAHAMMDLSTIFQIHGHPEVAAEFQSNALALQQHYRVQPGPHRDALRLLAIMGPGSLMANMPIEFLVEPLPIQLETLYLGEGLPVPQSIPDHDVAMIALCESDQNQTVLQHLEEVVRYWPRPILNQPSQIRKLARNAFSRDCYRMQGVVTSPSMRYAREKLSEVAFQRHIEEHAESVPHGWIIRPVDSHAGHGLDRFVSPADLAIYLEEVQSDEYFVAKFIDYRSHDGKYRKYRVAMIQGELFPVHMAISQHWIVHYLNADMLHNADHRQEESEFMEHFEHEFADRHRQAFAQLHSHLALDYVVFDCAETLDGELVVFEADNGAVVHSMDPPDIFPYKTTAMNQIFHAFYRSIRSTSSQSKAA